MGSSIPKLLRLSPLQLWRIQQVRFLVVGLANTVIGYMLFVGFVLLLGKGLYLVAAVVSHLLATTVSFGLNRKYVFESTTSILREYLRFQMTYTVILGAKIPLLIGLVEFLGWNVFLAQGILLVFVATSSYLGHRYFSFRRSDTSEPSL